MLTLEQCQLLAYRMADDEMCPEGDASYVLINASIEKCTNGCPNWRLRYEYGNYAPVTACLSCGIKQHGGSE